MRSGKKGGGILDGILWRGEPWEPMEKVGGEKGTYTG
jgi:hypothetical protein